MNKSSQRTSWNRVNFIIRHAIECNDTEADYYSYLNKQLNNLEH